MSAPNNKNIIMAACFVIAKYDTVIAKYDT